MSSQRPNKKPTINGFSLFRRQVLLEIKQQRKPINEEEINELTNQKWKYLSEEEKAIWKARAKEDKMIQRSNRLPLTNSNQNAAIATDDEFLWPVVQNAVPPSQEQPRQQKEGLPNFIFRAGPPKRGETCGPPTFPLPSQLPSSMSVGVSRLTTSRPPRTRSFGFGGGRGGRGGQESFLKAIDNLELKQNPAKRRHQLRKELYTKFTWNYEHKKDELKSTRFYVLSCQPLGPFDFARSIPAEVCCSEFSIDSGLRNFFCATIKPPDSVIPFKEDITVWGLSSYGLTFDQLQQTGVTCDEVARRLLDMIKNRERLCSEIKFFVLASEFGQTADCLEHIFLNYELNSGKKHFDKDRHLACVDDMIQSIFKFFTVDYSWASVPDDGRLVTSDNPIDLTAVLRTLNGYQDGGVLSGTSEKCPIHGKMLDACGKVESSKVCCLLTHTILAEMLRSAVQKKRLDLCDVQNLWAPFGTNTRQNVAQDLPPTNTGETFDNKRKVSVSTVGTTNNSDASFCSTLHSGAKDEAAGADSFATDQRQNFKTGEPYTNLSCNNGHLSENVGPREHQQRATMDNLETTLTPASLLPTTVVPNTSAVQHLLPAGRRGLGRGLHLTPEGALLCALRTNVSFS